MASVFYIDLAFENCFGTIIEILQLGTLFLYFEQGFPHLAYLSCCIYMNLHLKVGHSRYLIAHHLNLIGNYLLIGNLYSTLYRSLMSLFSQGAARASIYSGDPFDCLQFFSYHILQDYLNFFLFQLSEIANLNLIRNCFLLFKVMAVLYHYYQNIIWWGFCSVSDPNPHGSALWVIFWIRIQEVKKAEIKPVPVVKTELEEQK